MKTQIRPEIVTRFKELLRMRLAESCESRGITEIHGPFDMNSARGLVTMIAGVEKM